MIPFNLAGWDAFVKNMRKRLRRYYTPYEVAQHCTPYDCWVSFLGGVYDISPLVKGHEGPEVQALIAAAGKDISHWFNPETQDLRTYVCPETQIIMPYCPQGSFVHVQPMTPTSNWDATTDPPWWKDTQYKVGYLSLRTRIVRIKNVLTCQEDQLEVPSEETIAEIRERYLDINAHAKSYTWRALKKQKDGTWEFQEMDMNTTLDDNFVRDESQTFEDHHIPQDYYIPVLHVYWNDDLTIA